MTHDRGRCEAPPADPERGSPDDQRARGRGDEGRSGDRRRPTRRRLHPAVLLPRADELGRHVPHVPRRHRHRSRPGVAAVVHGHRCARHGGQHPERRGVGGPRRHHRAAARQPSARLPGVRQGWRVPAAGSVVQPRSRRESLRRGEAPLREADPDQRSGAARPRALHPVRSLHPLRRRGRRRRADPLHQSRQRHPDHDVPRRAVRQLLQRQHRADLPGRCAHRQAVPVQGPPVGSRADREHLHHVCGRLPHGRAVEPRRAAALPGCRQRSGQLGLAVRPRSVQLRGGQQRRSAELAAGARRRRAATDDVERGAGPRRRTDHRSQGRRWRRLDRRARWGARHQRRRLRLGPARPRRHRHAARVPADGRRRARSTCSASTGRPSTRRPTRRRSS